MDTTKLYGTGVALVTPFNKDESIDFDGLKRLLESTAKQGVDYYVVQGTTGESVTTTPAEKQQILDFVKKNNSAKLPIVFGIGGNNTRQIIENIKSADLSGVDAILSVSPYYNKPSQAGIIKHFELVADESPIPVILYNVPGRTSSNLTAETTLTLAKHPNIIGVKEASGSVEQSMAISANKPSDFLLISGDDMLTVPLYSIGSKGVISVLANAFGDIFKEMKDNAFSGNYEAASKAAFKLQGINPLMYQESNPVGIKEVLKLQGICDNYVRLPLLSASSNLQSQIKSTLDSM
ncbi:4-hydroxy-tetrahydrodipicolinate synthase [Fulvivirga lutea]|uniref:4-hydroxy-tetrahydrodipicolinate synthase n=1 Tax=Fulvivirga lutea TaxID=2810512 RepID=A0A974ZZQ5_9BACT|nr:4-hydroxy-tetrahydrodipicolinate synthase [Fulvivirga lutea]QSE96385.1 4-hydroxy-tetrahydrodipicolinate synthase [Fulvivirga lutea]